MGIEQPRLTMSMFQSKADLYAELAKRNKETADDLLEALEAARDVIAGFPRSMAYDMTHLPAIDSAIKKAKGEQ